LAQGLYYLLTLIVVGLVIRWYAQNDRLAPGEPTKGILRMARQATAKKKRSRFTAPLEKTGGP
jgi:hypothetical protein